MIGGEKGDARSVNSSSETAGVMSKRRDRLGEGMYFCMRFGRKSQWYPLSWEGPHGRAEERHERVKREGRETHDNQITLSHPHPKGPKTHKHTIRSQITTLLFEIGNFFLAKILFILL